MKTTIKRFKGKEVIKEFDYLLPISTNLTIDEKEYNIVCSFYNTDSKELIIYVSLL